MFGSRPVHQIPLGYYLFKGNSGVPTGQRKFDLGGVWTHDLWIKSSNALPTELRGQYCLPLKAIPLKVLK